MLSHPSECPKCIKLHRLTVARVRLSWSKVPVLSWCRVCGLPVLLEVMNDYNYAKQNFYAMDDHPMAHKNVHAERGGWGVHWRFDDVLWAVFGNRHREECWPAAAWYQQTESMELAVQVLSMQDALEYSNRSIDMETQMLLKSINHRPRTREQIKEWLSTHTVWDTEEMRREFDILGFKAPFAIVLDKKSGQRGSVLFQNDPRYYFSFDPDRVI